MLSVVLVSESLAFKRLASFQDLCHLKETLETLEKDTSNKILESFFGTRTS